MPIPVIIAAIAAAASVGGAVKGGVDADKKRKFEQNLALLNKDQQKQLEYALINAKSEEARLKIISDVLGSSGNARIDALSRLQQEREKTKKTLLVVGIVGGVLVILTFILARKK